MTEFSQYQKRKQVSDLMKSLDKGQKGMLFESLLGEWAETFPKKGKDYGVASGNAKYTERLEWLSEHWGTQFVVEKKDKETKALRKMPLSGVLELLTLFCLNVADSGDEDPSFGSLEDGSELGEKVASGLSALKSANGPQVVISLEAFRELQRLAREAQEGGAEGPRTSTAIVEKLASVLKDMPSVKTEKETKIYSTRRTKYDAKKKAEIGFTNK